ncbi:MAG: site-specific DNA-methyltransferase, partial [Caldisericum exile]|uniref:site-specific DNA-methyltransferase n=1 Tax=Caldisericum exile TaxID=693075 RepID=UPI003C713541
MNTVQKFQELLKKVFQFSASDLDFGIYRILNYKRDQIEKFIKEDLVNKVETAFAKYKDKRIEDIHQRLEEARRKIKETIGDSAFSPTGELKPEYRDTPVGKDYLTLKAQKEEAEKIEEVKLQVFNDLYNFFSRYYEEGDFIPQYRYSIKGHKYAIPYNGEEVKLYCANSEQYYTKTGLLFRDYAFFIDTNKSYKVLFRIVSAKEELGSNKATKERFFILDEEKPVELEDKTLIIRFQYRELMDKEVKYYEVEGGSNTAKQERINQKSYEKVLSLLKTRELKGLLSQNRNGKPLLLYQISRFTAKNTKDYFIHKNLKKFLSEQLDYFIKSEVLDIETLERERFLDKHITRAKVVREIGEAIIDFLSQIEDFQKRLWEKKKFVIKTDYVITMDRIKDWTDAEFYKKVIDKVLENKEQLKEWKELGFGDIKDEKDLEGKKLPIDTKYFDEKFKLKLLERISEKTDLGVVLDGVLIKSENWQALNTILNRYKERVQTIYIDPPYNTGSDEFLYRDRYQHSCWLTMMENRLSLARELMSKDGVIFVSIGDTIKTAVRINSSSRLQCLLNELFNEDNFVASFIRKSGTAPRQDIKHIANAHDYILCYAKNLNMVKINKKKANMTRLKYKDEYFEIRGYFDLNQLDRGSIQYSESLDYPIVIEKGEIIEVFDGKNFSKIPAPERIEIWPGGDPNDKRWIFRWSKEKVLWGINNGFIVFRKVKHEWKVYYKEYELVDNEGRPRERTNPYDTLILDYQNELGTSEIENLFSKRLFEYPKPSDLIRYLMEIGSSKDSIILDFFTGSGTTAHAVM